MFIATLLTNPENPSLDRATVENLRNAWGGGEAQWLATGEAAEFEMASIVVDPVRNAEFASHKGSTPVRVDAPTDKLDACNKLVLESLEVENGWVLNPFYISDSDWINSVWNTMFTFQGDTSMTTDDAIEMLKDEFDAVFN